MNSKIILGHPFGNANVRQALIALFEVGLLESFVTTICAEHVPFLSLLPRSIRMEIKRRSFIPIPPEKISSHSSKELARLFSNRVGRYVSALSRFGPSVDDVWRSLDWCLAREATDREQGLAVYAYEDGAFATFSTLPDARKIYELPIGYWKSMHNLLKEERELKPEWSPTLKGLSDNSAKLERKDMELTLADQIIVPSDFVKSTLPTHWSTKTAVVRYGCPPQIQIAMNASGHNGPLRILYCGSLGQRKGISYLFDAVERMGRHVVLTVVGSEVAPCAILRRSMANVSWYRSLPHAKVLEVMRDHDVFLFPTLFEGRALVVLEALSQGLLVVTTENSGTGDLVIDRQSGFLVPIRSVDAIVEALENLYEDRNLLQHMKEQALISASSRTWAHYRKDLVRAITNE